METDSSVWFIALGVGFLALSGIALWRDRRSSAPVDPGAATKIQRIRAYREQHGVGLKEARDAIEAQDRGESVPQPSATLPAPDASVEALAKQGQVIEAIKLYREQTGASLFDAKQAVDRLRK